VSLASALKRAEILDTPLEPQYDNLVNLAAFITKAPALPGARGREGESMEKKF